MTWGGADDDGLFMRPPTPSPPHRPVTIHVLLSRTRRALSLPAPRTPSRRNPDRIPPHTPPLYARRLGGTAAALQCPRSTTVPSSIFVLSLLKHRQTRKNKCAAQFSSYSVRLTAAALGLLKVNFSIILRCFHSAEREYHEEDKISIEKFLNKNARFPARAETKKKKK